MALGRRNKTEQAEAPKGESTATPSETFLDEGCALSGVLRFAEDVRIEGRVEGEVCAQKSVVVGGKAEIDASIEAESIEVYGTVLGDVRVARRTILHKTSHVEGEIHTAGIVIEEGARFKGRIVIGSDEDVHQPANTHHQAAGPGLTAVDGTGSGNPSER